MSVTTPKTKWLFFCVEHSTLVSYPMKLNRVSQQASVLNHSYTYDVCRRFTVHFGILRITTLVGFIFRNNSVSGWFRRLIEQVEVL